jgi:hypothetical protein
LEGQILKLKLGRSHFADHAAPSVGLKGQKIANRVESRSPGGLI